MQQTEYIHDLDQERLKVLYADDRDMLAMAFDMFVDDVLPDFVELEQRVSEKDWPEVSAAAHRLRPWLGMVGLTSLEELLRQLEFAAKESTDDNQLTGLWQQFDAGLKQMTPIVQAERKQL